MREGEEAVKERQAARELEEDHDLQRRFIERRRPKWPG